ncbi:hypothetical protein V6N13_009705 [Hibiscus sabdariffa]
MEPMKAPPAESPAKLMRHTAGELEIGGFGIVAFEELGSGLVSVEEFDESKEAIFIAKMSAFCVAIASLKKKKKLKWHMPIRHRTLFGLIFLQIDG